MTEIELMIENIEAAMHALDNAEKAAKDLHAHAKPEVRDEFQTRMQALRERLERLQQILTHEAEYMEDEAIEALNATLGTPSGYHRIPHFEVELKR